MVPGFLGEIATSKNGTRNMQDESGTSGCARREGSSYSQSLTFCVKCEKSSIIHLPRNYFHAQKEGILQSFTRNQCSLIPCYPFLKSGKIFLGEKKKVL